MQTHNELKDKQRRIFVLMYGSSGHNYYPVLKTAIKFELPLLVLDANTQLQLENILSSVNTEKKVIAHEISFSLRVSF